MKRAESPAAYSAGSATSSCFAFWAWLRLAASPWWLVRGMARLAVFAFLRTLVDADFAGRAYAYGDIYVAASLSSLWAVKGRVPDRWDILGAAVCMLCAGIILLNSRETLL